MPSFRDAKSRPEELCSEQGRLRGVEGGLLRRGDDWSQALKGEQDFPTNETGGANQEVSTRAK